MQSVSRSRGKRSAQRGLALNVQSVESRVLLSANVIDHTTAQVVHHSAASPSGHGYTPSQILTAYGFNQVSFSNGANGTGQTIAIVDAYNDPTILADLQAFDSALGLANPPSLTVMSQTGSTTNLPPADPSSKSDDWEIEESLDVEWAHALAPGANIVLVEANSASEADLMAAVRTAANLPNVSVVSMSWGGSEFSSESAYDSYFTTPAGHQGITFVASTGDNASPAGYPAYSPNVLAVGGTTLTINSSGGYVSESGWSNSGGGVSKYESQPGYQSGFVKQSSTKRAAPDVAFDADPNTGVPVYDSFSFGTSQPWIQVGGTSFSAPAWAAIIAIADQGRVLNGSGTLNGATQTLPMLYNLDKTNPSAFHDVTSGNNGYAASTGYDLVTGLGSPVVNQIVSGLVGTTQTLATRLVFQQSPSSGTAGIALGTVKVAVENQSGQILTSDNSTVTLSIGSGPGSFAAGTLTAQVVNGIATFSNLTLDTSGSYTLRATDGSDTAATSGSVTIAAGQAAKVAFQQVPATGTVGTALGTVTVAVEDQFGNLVTSDNSTVTLSVASGPGSLAGTMSATAVNGVAAFTHLSLSVAGTYTLRATDGTLTTATSSTISVTVGSGGGGSTLSAPSASATAVNSTTAQLNWTASTGATGYRIYQVISGRSVLLGTVSASTTSVQVYNLVAGSTASFKVEAFNSTSVADSAIVSITLPQSQRLSTPVVQGTALSATSVQLSWGAVAGAQGYRVYIWNGHQAVLLGSVSSNTTTVSVDGLSGSSSYQFLIEAYNRSMVADSNWVTITTPAGRHALITHAHLHR